MQATAIAFAPGGEWLVAGTPDGKVRALDARDGSLKSEERAYGSQTVVSLTFSPDGSTIASIGDHAEVALWSVSPTGALVRNPIEILERPGLNGIAFSPSSELFIASSEEERTVHIRSTRTGEIVRTLEGHTLGVNAVALSPRGDLVATGSKDGTVRLWPQR
jgi:WD40 repeat protein